MPPLRIGEHDAILGNILVVGRDKRAGVVHIPLETNILNWLNSLTYYHVFQYVSPT